MTSVLPWRGPGPDRPDLPLPPGKVPLRRDGSLAQALALSRGVLRRAPALRGAGQVGPSRADVLGGLGPRAPARCASAPDDLVPGARGEVWTERRGPEDAGRIDWAPDSAADPGADRGGGEARRRNRCVASCASARASWVEAVCPTGEGRLRLDPEADRAASSATCGSASGGSAVEARGCRGRVVRLPPPPHGLGLVRRGRHGDRRARGRLEPGQRDQRPAAGLRARRSGPAASLGARPGRASRASRRSSSTEARLEFSAEARAPEARGHARSSSYSYRQPFGSLHRHAARAGSSSQRASA